MCYEVRSLTLSKLKYLKRYGGDVFEIKKLEKLIEQFSPQYHASGFDHPDLPVITNTLEIRTMNWGLIPHWTKNAA
ncbi:MAG TPA: SOS response-associated peptidase, partial [Cytophagales bacterium]|nr:SOS response-associated peptidase [Cytophagales bacterium]